MTDDRARDALSSWTGSTTRRAVLKLTGLVSLLRYAPGSATATERTDDTKSDVPSPARTALSDVRRSATLGGPRTQYARALALDGDTALVGIPPAAGGVGPSNGRAVLFTRTEGTWRPNVTLVSGDIGGQFGRAVALSNDLAVIGAELGSAANDAHSGSAGVYARTGEAWTQVTRLSAPNPDGVDRFGMSVAVTDNTILVGASTATTDSGQQSGAAYAFERSRSGWTQMRPIIPPTDDVVEFGRSVAIDAETAVVGARRVTGRRTGDSGVVVVYHRDGKRWRRQATLTPSETTRDDEFGTTVSVDTGTIVVGAPRESNDTGRDAGAVYVFADSGTGWRRQSVLHAGDGAATHQFGTALALDGDAVLVGSRSTGGPLAFVRSHDEWTPVGELDHGRRGVHTGGPVLALDGRRALVGSDDTPVKSVRTQPPVEVFEPE